MKFRYEFDIKKLPWPVNHRHRLLLIGSCFTENIGEKLKHYKFSVLENPHGILFNPVSVVDAIDDYLHKKVYQEQNLFYYNELWHSWKHHSRFSALSSEESLKRINDSISEAHEFLKSADFIFITLGSAWVYQLTDHAENGTPGSVAANNHKAPANWFERKLLSPDEVFNGLNELIERLSSFNNQLKIIFTISPVRHLREGVIDNNRSKAALIQAVHKIAEVQQHVYYFPAYELVLDDLRDYRFYAEDLVHPNYFATQYVWERFVNACMNDETKILMHDIHSINLAMKHKAFNPTSMQHKEFLKSFHEKTLQLMQKYPWLNLHKEVEYFARSV